MGSLCRDKLTKDLALDVSRHAYCSCLKIAIFSFQFYLFFHIWTRSQALPVPVAGRALTTTVTWWAAPSSLGPRLKRTADPWARTW